MQIDIPPNDQNRLSALAAEAGYDSVERYASDYLQALAKNPTAAELSPLTDEELQASLAMCDKSIAQIERGKGMGVEEARRQTLAELQPPKQ